MIKQLSFIIAAVLLLGYMELSHQNTTVTPVTTVSTAGNGLCWTKWYNEDHPKFIGDYETLKKIREKNPGEICQRPLEIQAVKAEDGTPAEKTGQKFHAYNNEEGFICRNEDQKIGQHCFDYKVRFGCPC